MMSLFKLDLEEEWRPVVGFEGFYSVSNLGRVRNERRIVQRSNGKAKIPQRVLKPSGCRYLSVDLWVDGISYNKLVHRLVAEAFVPNPDNLPEVNHKDRNTLNCKAENLEWATSSSNHHHLLSNAEQDKSYRIKVKCLDNNVIYSSISEAGRSIGVDATQIIESIKSKSCCKGLTFVYADRLPLDEIDYLQKARNKYQKFHSRPCMPNSLKVKVIETGQEFDSIASAARYLSCDTATITNRIKSHKCVDGVTLAFSDDCNII